jgi:ribosomal protein RSM22 (predicted rRNA methylase)
MELPGDLRGAIDVELDTVPPREISAAAERLSQRYRNATTGSGVPLVRSRVDALAYTAYRMPATFAALVAVFREVRLRRPNLWPRSLLDVGAGPGTGAWAAAQVWPELHRIVCIERDAHMTQVGKALAARADSSAILGAQWIREDASEDWTAEPADVTLAGYVIGELPSGERARFVETLWRQTNDTCVIVEPGTPAGFASMVEAGSVLTASRGWIVAPFPQEWQCLESENDWCHFSVRVPRTRFHRAAKQAKLAYEDEKYAYVAGSRISGNPIAARIIRHPQVRSGHLRLVLCTAFGVKHIVVSRRDRLAYRRAKDLYWGSAIELEDAELFGLSV